MAQKRMFSLSVVDTDLFLEMPMTCRLLYYELGMRADDDGFVGNWKKIMRMTGLSEDDMKVLIAKDFIIPFESGVIVIKHWRMNNYLRNDRHTPTAYQKELSQLKLTNEVYELESTEKTELLPVGIPDDNQLVYPDKNSIDKSSIEKGSMRGKTKKFVPPTLEEVSEYIHEKNYSVDASVFWNYYNDAGWIDSNDKKVKSWKGKVRTWNMAGCRKQTTNYTFEIE